MNAHAERQLSLHTTLTEYAVHDARLLVSDMVRESLVIVSAESGAPTAQDAMHRALAVRLVERSGALGERFAALLLADLRGMRAVGMTAATPCLERLAASIEIEDHDALAAVERPLASEQPGFDLGSSALAPLSCLRKFDRALSEQGFSDVERVSLWRAWGGVAFASALRHAYARYVRVLDQWHAVTLGTHQDFVATWPMPLPASALR